MKFFITSESVSYTRKGRKTLCDVFSSLKKAITHSDGIVPALLRNGKSITPYEKSLKCLSRES